VVLRTLIVLVLLGGLAAAEIHIAAEPPAKPVEPARPVCGPASTSGRPCWDLGFAFAGGAAVIGDQTFGQFGLRVHLARRIGDRNLLVMMGELLATNRGSGEALVIGETVRGLVGLDRRLGRVRDFPIPEVFGAAGIGGELTAWDRGTVTRPLVYVGVDARQGFDMPPDRPLRGVRRFAMRYGVRVQAARDVPPMTLARACSGCSPATPDRSLDIAVIGYYGIDFGR
jgi:hypothetical protein